MLEPLCLAAMDNLPGLAVVQQKVLFSVESD